MPRTIGVRPTKSFGGVALVMITLAAACSDSSTTSKPPETTAYFISVTAGNNQVALPATALASPLAVRVTDQASVPVSGVTVEFAGAGSASG
ncbi:MAG: hypothetical protein ABIR59_08645, partial [Gemmatimonadales bacterium]